MIHRPRGRARTRCLVWSQQSPLEFFQYGSGQPCARVSRVLTKATSYLIAYLTGTLDAAIWGAELAAGAGRERIYIVEPTGRSWTIPISRTRNFLVTRRSPTALVSRSGSWAKSPSGWATPPSG